MLAAESAGNFVAINVEDGARQFARALLRLVEPPQPELALDPAFGSSLGAAKPKRCGCGGSRDSARDMTMP